MSFLHVGFDSSIRLSKPTLLIYEVLMCGITGVLNLTEHPPVDIHTLRQMLEMIRHRGPDGFGIYRDAHIGMGNARLSIIDIAGGDQPIGNEDGSLWIVFNGEIFNYVELRPELEARGHQFITHCDTEVILHLYEEYGPGCLRHLNGQFAIAIWDARKHSLFLARDRVGIRPVFYTVNDGYLVFGSEIKSMLAHPSVNAEIDPQALEQVFTFWSAQSPRSIFKGIYELPAGHYLLAQDGAINIQPFWGLDFTQDANSRTEGDYLEELENLLIDATRIRLRADVPVGAYLSGGLDSSITTAVIRNYTNTHLDTFSISFSDPEFDESYYQLQMADFLGTEHHVVFCTHEDIGQIFPNVIWHTETPLLRTAPAPMFLLSRLVRENNYKVVLTGEGADEFLGGYDIFKEMKIRRFWAQQPDSQARPRLFQRLYPDIKGLDATRGSYLAAFFKRDLLDTASPYYSHAIRWGNTARTRRFLASPTPQSESIAGAPPYAPPPAALPASFANWSALAQAQYLEVATFLSPYLLSSQGDRVAMAHSVEGRYPFLDYRVIEFCNRLPPHVKLRGLTEKWLLKQMGRKLLPETIWQRRKRPYRAPIQRSFFPTRPLEYVRTLLSDQALQASNLFEPSAVTRLVDKAASGAKLSEVDDMALVGILSAQLVHLQFVRSFETAPICNQPNFKIVDRAPVSLAEYP
jgi:asparagine synthase (glutamine-hydrolysing)